jgi:hypothetical protein
VAWDHDGELLAQEVAVSGWMEPPHPLAQDNQGRLNTAPAVFQKALFSQFLCCWPSH